ncbi:MULTISPECIES: hypothetical protein [unclassified Streptomyces]|uniref:hypothetical protein n=1 Tax=unclassified Streptomyces TaxID=2593676 RepID=UPI00278C8C0D|nr:MULTISPECIES: hypothetical protein [unclassified Streptomyces]
MSEERGEHLSKADIDRRFAAIVQDKPVWYLVPSRILCTMTFFMSLWLCIAVNGGDMNEARWGSATLISFCVSVASGAVRRVARARYDRRARRSP